MYTNSKLEEMRNLIEKLKYYTKYYDEGNPKISDKEWDELYFKLFNLELETGEYYADSPTHSIVFTKVSELNKIEHNHPMLSLQKTKSIDELNTFINNKDFIVMLKLDGLTCSLSYDKGKLISAETRGNGTIGEDITHNAFVVSNIPKKIPFKGKLTIDGEIICLYKNFKPFAKEYKNPRNFAAGSIRLLDSKECANRNLSFIAWDVIEAEYVEFQTLVDKFNFLIDNNFSVVNYDSTLSSINENFIEEFKSFNENLYPIDGLVIKYNNCKEYDNAGRTDHHFKGGIAYKFYDEEYETILLDIEWSIGRTGVLTPIAIFEPIDIDGTECSRASLHNVSIMEELSNGFQGKGDKLFIYKANQIIPQVSKWEHINDFSEDTHLSIPIECPICGGICDIVQENDSKILMCMNELCEGKINNRLIHFCGKKGLDIKGLADSTIEKLIDWGWVNCYEDIFNLKDKREQWIKKTGFGEKSVDRILDAIETAKNTTFDKFISAIGIPLIGVAVAKELNKYIASYEEFRDKINNNFDFSQYNGFGGHKNNYILNYDYTEADKVRKHLSFEDTGILSAGNLFENKVFVITGRLNKYKNRAELKAIIENNGGKVTDSVSKNTTILINNDINSKSSKNESAKKLNIPIITEEEFEKMLWNF